MDEVRFIKYDGKLITMSEFFKKAKNTKQLSLPNEIFLPLEDKPEFFPHCLTFADNKEDEDLCNKITFVNFDNKDEYNSRQCVNDLITNYIRNGRPIDWNIQDLKEGTIESPFVFPRDYKDLKLSKTRKIKLKKQQKFMSKLINPQSNIRGMLIYHGLGSGKTGTSIVVGEAFKKYYADKTKDEDLSKTPGSGRSSGKIVVVVPAQTKEQYKQSILGSLYSIIMPDITEEDREKNKQLIEKNYKELSKKIDKFKKCIEKNTNDFTSFTNEIEIDKERQNYTNIVDLLEKKKINYDDKKSLTKSYELKILERIAKNYIVLSREKFTRDLFNDDDFFDPDKKETFRYTQYNPKNHPFFKTLQEPNGLLIIDEIQNLVSEKGIRYKSLLKAIKYYFHPTTRVILLTATPIYNDVYELGLTINLLQPRIPFPDNKKKFDEMFIGKLLNDNEYNSLNDLKKKNDKQKSKIKKHKETMEILKQEIIRCGKIKDSNKKSKLLKEIIKRQEIENKIMINKDLFEYMCSGYVSYFKGGNPKGFPKKITEYVYVEMNSKQIETYQKVLKSSLKRLERDSLNINYFVKCREISNIVIPITKFIENDNSSQNASQQRRETFIDDMCQDINTIGKKKEKIKFVSNSFSSKFAKVIENIENEEYGKGTHFVYSSFYYSGVYSLGRILETMGWKDLTEDLDSINNERSNKSFVIWSGSLNKRKTKGEKIKDITKKKDEFRRIVTDSFNDMKNKQGKKIKIIFGTTAIMEGIDFKHVKYVHILEPWWNDSRIEQVEARAIRWKSHTNLNPNEQFVKIYKYYSTINKSDLTGINNFFKKPIASGDLAKELIQMNLDKQNFDDDKVRKYVFNTTDWKFNKQEDELIHPLTNKSIDNVIQRSAGNKKKIFQKFYKSVKESSIDCLFNKWGNILRFEKEIYKRNEDIFNLDIFKTLKIQNNEELILYYDPSDNLYYHTKGNGKNFTILNKKYGGRTLFTFSVIGTINNEEFLSFNKDTIKKKEEEETFYNIIQKENLECSISETTGKKFEGKDIKKLKDKSNPKIKELLQNAFKNINRPNLENHIESEKSFYTKLNNCLKKKKNYYAKLKKISEKIKEKDSSKDKLIKDIAALIVSEIKRFHEVVEDYEKKNDYINNLLELEDNIKEKLIECIRNKQLINCIKNKKLQEQNRVLKQQGIESKDINNFLKDQSKNTLEDYFNKLKGEEYDYANRYLEKIIVDIIEHKNEKVKKTKITEKKQKKVFNAFNFMRK